MHSEGFYGSVSLAAIIWAYAEDNDLGNRNKNVLSIDYLWVIGLQMILVLFACPIFEEITFISTIFFLLRVIKILLLIV